MINISRKLKWANNNEKEEKVNYFHKVFTRKTIKPHCKSTLFITCLFPLVLSCYSQVWLFAIPWALQAPLSTEFSWQECWSGFPCPPSGDLPDSGIESMSSATPALQADSLPLRQWGSPFSPWFCSGWLWQDLTLSGTLKLILISMIIFLIHYNPNISIMIQISF